MNYLTPEQQEIFRQMRGLPGGILDAGQTVARGVGGQVAGGYAGLLDLVRGKGVDAAANRVREVEEGTRRDPETKMGAQILERAGEAIEPVATALKENVADPVGKYSPLLGAALVAAPEALPGPKVGKVAKAAKAPKPLQSSASGEPMPLAQLRLRERPIEEAVQMALRGQHLNLKEGGGFAGAPRNVKTMDDLIANRLRQDENLASSVQQLTDAGEPVGDWYPSQRRGIESTTEPWMRQYTGKIHAETSAGVTPENERDLVNKGWNRAMRGKPVGILYTGAQGKRVEQGIKGTRPMAQGKKISNYAKLSETDSDYGTNDFREAQNQGYTDTAGEPQTMGMNPQQHAFMDAESLGLVQRAIAKGTGGRVDWTGPMVQEIPWITSKADYYQTQFPKRYPQTQEGRNAAIRDASKTAEDFVRKQAAGANYSMTPGKSTGHLPELHEAPLSEQRAYAEAAPAFDKEGKDVYYKGARAMQLPTERTTGEWQGKPEAGYMAQPQADFLASGPNTGKIPGGVNLDPDMRSTLQFIEGLRGTADVQAAGGYNVPFTQANRKAGTKTHGLIEHEGRLSEGEARDLNKLLGEGWMAVPTPRGTGLLQFGKDSRGAAKDIKAMEGTVGPVTRAGMETELIPAWERTAQGGTAQTPKSRDIPIEPGSGVITRRLLRRAANAPEEVVRGVSESEEVRKHMGRLIDRDLALETEGKQISWPAQKTRGFLRDADWNKAVEILRKNPKTKAATVIASLGYSLSGMAEDDIKKIEREAGR